MSTQGPEVTKSPNDSRDYRYIILENGLQAVLIHDAVADKAAAAMDVNIGTHFRSKTK